MSPLEQFLPYLLQHPLHRAMGLREIETADGTAWFEVDIGPDTVNTADMFHGGVVYALADLAALSAALTRLPEGHFAVTHDLHVSMMRAGMRGQRARFEGRVLRMGRSLAFIQVEVSCAGEVLTRASVTKSILKSAR